MEETVGLKELFLVVLRKTKFIVVLMLAFCIIGGSIKFFPGLKSLNNEQHKTQKETIYNENLKKYDSEKTEIKNQIEKIELDIENTEKYMEESLLYKINPYNEYISEVQLYFSLTNGNSNSDDKQQLSYYYYELAKSGELSEVIKKELASNYDIRYLKELYTINSSNNIITIKSIGSDDNQPSEIVNLVLNYLIGKQELIEKNVGKHSTMILNQSSSVIIDNDLIAFQNAKTDLLKNLKTQLAEKNTELQNLAQPVSESMMLSSILKSTIVFMFIGLFLGAMISVFIVLFMFFMSNRVVNQGIIKKQFDINFLANLSKKTIDNTKYNFVEKFINKIEGNISFSLSQKEQIEKLKIKIQLLIEEASNCNIILTGSVDEDYLRKICELLQNGYKDNSNISLSYGKNPLMSAETMQKILTSTNVILIEENQKSSLDIIEQEIETIKEINKPIIGYIMI